MKKNIDNLMLRAGLLFFILLFEVLFVIYIISRFKDAFTYFHISSMVFSILVLLYILSNNDINPSFKISKIIPILAFPAFGWILYILFSNDIAVRKAERETKKYYLTHKQELSKMLKCDKAIMRELETLDKNAMCNVKYLLNYANAQIFKNYDSTYFGTGEEYYKNLLIELEKAEEFIFMEYFIIEEGKMWSSILDILERKAKNGVDVRVVYDDMGCMLTLPKNYNEFLNSKGIKCCVFNPVSPIFSMIYNNRTHRKITSIDGKVGFTGGLNLADEYINEIVKFGHWKDSGIMIKGDSVWGLTFMFLNMWEAITMQEIDYLKFRQKFSEKPTSDGYIVPFNDTPFDKEEISNRLYINIISNATDYIYITSPYLIIDAEMTSVLVNASKRGVDVKIITPFIADKKPVLETTRAHYRPLLEANIEIYEYTPGFIHSKNFICDDLHSIVGTINLDYRSLYLHFECATWLYNSKIVRNIKSDFLETMNKSKKITLNELNEISMLRKLYRSILKVFAPLM